MKKYLIANWKMNMSLENVKTWLDTFCASCPVRDTVEIILAPSYMHLPYVFEQAQKCGFDLAAQDVSEDVKGAHTGEVGAFQIKDFCKYCIVGHSEQKNPLEEVLRKRDLCVRAGITPVICFVEIDTVEKLYVENALLAWEDPANISHEGVFSPKPVEEIKKAVAEIKGRLPADSLVFYGGSVNRQNMTDLVNISKLDGVLVGSASLDPVHFADLAGAYL